MNFPIFSICSYYKYDRELMQVAQFEIDTVLKVQSTSGCMIWYN